MKHSCQLKAICVIQIMSIKDDVYLLVKQQHHTQFHSPIGELLYNQLKFNRLITDRQHQSTVNSNQLNMQIKAYYLAHKLTIMFSVKFLHTYVVTMSSCSSFVQLRFRHLLTVNYSVCKLMHKQSY